MPDLAVIVPCVINSELVKKNAGANDPWGLEYTKQNTAGGGAYRVAKWTPGTELVFERNESWKNGPLPTVRRVIGGWCRRPATGGRSSSAATPTSPTICRTRILPSSSRTAKLPIVSTPYSNGIQYIGMNVTKPPFDNLKVRQAVACAIPYRKIMDAVLFGLAKPMFGAPPEKATEVAWPQPHAVRHRPRQGAPASGRGRLSERIRDDALLRSRLRRSSTSRSACSCRRASAQIGIKTTINKIPGANWRTELNKKEMPLFTNVFSGWLDYPEYFFFWCYHGTQFRLQHDELPESKAMDGFIDGARAAASVGDTARYDKDVRGFVDLAFADVPRIPLFQPYVTSRCRRTCPATSTGSTAGSTTGRSSRPRQQ